MSAILWISSEFSHEMGTRYVPKVSTPLTKAQKICDATWETTLREEGVKTFSQCNQVEDCLKNSMVQTRSWSERNSQRYSHLQWQNAQLEFWFYFAFWLKIAPPPQGLVSYIASYIETRVQKKYVNLECIKELSYNICKPIDLFIGSLL